MKAGRVVGTIELLGEVWKISADPDIVIRLKRALPGIRSARADHLYISDTDTIGRELDWITDRWQFKMSDTDRQHLTRRARADLAREELVSGIIGGTATIVPKPSWISPVIPLRETQRTATDLARASGATLIGDELGGGKTALSLALLEDPDARPALAVVLTGLGRQWLRQLRKFYPQLSGYEIRTTKADKEKRRIFDRDGRIQYDLILVNYAKLASWRYHLAGHIRTVIFDEVQELRRPESQKYEAAAHIADKAAIRIGLSATPVYNFGGEIFAVMDALNRGSLGKRDEFLREWCSSGGYSDSGTMAKIRISDPEALQVHLKSRGLFLRRTLEEMGLPNNPVLTMEQDVPSDTAKFESMTGNAMEMAKLILAQDTSSSERFRTAGELDWQMRQATGIAKAPFVADFVKMLLASEERVLLLGWHRAVYDIWLERLKDYNPVMYTGSETSAGKARSVDAFLRGDARVMLMSLRSGAGLDGLQEVARTIVFGELDWSPGVHRQAIGRLARPGQEHKVLAYFCTSTDGADPVMLDTLNIKAMESARLTGQGDTIGAQPTDGSGSQIRALAADILRQNSITGKDRP